MLWELNMGGYATLLPTDISQAFGQENTEGGQGHNGKEEKATGRWNSTQAREAQSQRRKGGPVGIPKQGTIQNTKKEHYTEVAKAPQKGTTKNRPKYREKNI
eukprot:3849895-Amphidinium_carterae.1